MDKTIKRISKHEDEQYFKYVGVHLDEHLSYQSHIEHIELKVLRNLGIIYSAKKSIPTKMKMILYNTNKTAHRIWHWDMGLRKTTTAWENQKIK